MARMEQAPPSNKHVAEGVPVSRTQTDSFDDVMLNDHAGMVSGDADTQANFSYDDIARKDDFNEIYEQADDMYDDGSVKPIHETHCLPLWFIQARRSVKILIILSFLFLFSSIFMIAVHVSFTREQSQGSISASSESNGGIGVRGSDGSEGGNLPTSEPTMIPIAVGQAGTATDEPTLMPILSPTPNPTEKIAPNPTQKPTPSLTEKTTPNPTKEPTPNSTGETTPNPTNEPTPNPTEEPTPNPTEEPTNSLQTSQQTSPPTTSVPSEKPSLQTSSSPSYTPTVAPSQTSSSTPSYLPSPSESSTNSPSPTPSAIDTFSPSPTLEIIPTTTFFVTGGAFKGTEQGLQSLPSSDGEALFHLGDFINDSSCPSTSYVDFNVLYKSSSVPVFVSPGENEWNNCQNPTLAKQYWSAYLRNYDRQTWKGTTDYTVRRDPGRMGNFAFVNRRVQYIGITLLGGVFSNQADWNELLKANLRWVEEQVDKNVDDIDMIIIVGNTGPSNNNGDFFNPLYTAALRWQKSLTYIYESNSASTFSQNFGGNKYVSMLSVQVGVWPPLQVEVDVMEQNLSFDQSVSFTEQKKCEDSLGKFWFGPFRGIACAALATEDCALEFWKGKCPVTCDTCP